MSRRPAAPGECSRTPPAASTYTRAKWRIGPRQSGARRRKCRWGGGLLVTPQGVAAAHVHRYSWPAAEPAQWWLGRGSISIVPRHLRALPRPRPCGGIPPPPRRRRGACGQGRVHVGGDAGRLDTWIVRSGGPGFAEAAQGSMERFGRRGGGRAVVAASHEGEELRRVGAVCHLHPGTAAVRHAWGTQH